MRTRAWVGCLLALWGCPGGGDGGAGSGADWECEPEATGTWEIEYELQSGDCPPVTTEIINFDSDEMTGGLVDKTCDAAEPTGDACEGRNAMSSCYFELDDGTPVRTVQTIFLKQVGPDEITGRYMLSINAGGDICNGTYDVTGERL